MPLEAHLDYQQLAIRENGDILVLVVVAFRPGHLASMKNCSMRQVWFRHG